MRKNSASSPARRDCSRTGMPEAIYLPKDLELLYVPGWLSADAIVL